jgi:hypothetical protein
MPVYTFNVTEEYVTANEATFYITADNVEEASKQAIEYVKNKNHIEHMKEVDSDAVNMTLALLDEEEYVDKYILG